MAASAPQSPAHREANSYFDASPCRPSPSKLLRINQLYMDRSSSLPPRRLSSPSKKTPQIRPRLNQYFTLDHAVSLFKTSKNIIVLTGAGISTSLGVPDFRSVKGVYSLLVDSKYDDPQELFHIDNFKSDPDEFFKQAAKVFPRMQGLVPAAGADADSKSADVPLVPRFSLTHAFISMLQAKGKLLTNYTQNIDGLEVAAGVSLSKLIQCHGTLATATCMSCGKRTTARKYMPVVRAGGIPYCKCSLVPDPKPKPKPRGRGGKKKRKRYEFEDSDSEDDESKDGFPKGLLKPDMTFFGESIADSYASRLDVDKSVVDLLVIVGTSLKVEPVNEMLLSVPSNVPQIWISKDRCQREGVKVDIELLGECDLILEEIARRAGWKSSLEHRLWSSQNITGPTLPPREKKPPPSVNLERGQTAEKPSPAKKEDGLAMRPKPSDSRDAKPAPELIIKLNDEEIGTTAASALQTPVEVDTRKDDHEKSEQPASSHPVIQISETVKKSVPVSPPKVIIELEEGTRSRWFVRRAK